MLNILLILLVLLTGTFTDEELEGLYYGEYMIASTKIEQNLENRLIS